MHICTECGREDDNIRSTSLCRDCQLVLMLNLAGDNQKEIARLTSEVSELRRLGDAMAEQIGLNRYVQNKINKGADANKFIFFSEDDAAALDGWERAAKSREQTA